MAVMPLAWGFSRTRAMHGAVGGASNLGGGKGLSVFRVTKALESQRFSDSFLLC